MLQMLASDAPHHFESNLPNIQIQSRFYAPLKRRFHLEIERQPPLFPWESELSNYEAEELTPPKSTPPSFWSPQFACLQLPVPMPENLLEQLLERCQVMAAASLREGVKLVKAVEELFPNQSPLLNQLARMVMVTATRSGRIIPESGRASGFPEHYDNAQPAQKMALSLLAARAILNSLTLCLSRQQPVVERRWETQIGILLLKVGYRDNQLLIGGRLPCAGKMVLQNESGKVSAQRDTLGVVRLSLANPCLGTSYSLDVQLDTPGHPLVTFTIRIEV